MRQIRFSLGLCPRPRGPLGELTESIVSRPLAGLRVLLLREGREREGEGDGRRGGKGEGNGGRKGEGFISRILLG